MIDAVVFDMGGVFFETDPEAHAQVLAQHGLAAADLYRLRHLPVYKTYKAGEVDAATLAAELNPHMPGPAPDAEGLFRDLAMARVLNGELVGVAEKLRRTRRVAVLSNSDSFLEERIERFGIMDLFEFVINSYWVRMRKPEPRIFHHLLARIAVAPSRILFVDDKAANIRTARECGLHGHVFRDNEGLMEDLAAWSLLD